MKIEIRSALHTDGEEIVNLLRRLITDLCGVDHNSDPTALNNWLANKTVANWFIWLDRANAAVRVAQDGMILLGVGMVDQTGEVRLPDVSGTARFQGVSTKLLLALGDIARKSDLPGTHLRSTKTAEAFYVARGYRPVKGNATPRHVEKLLSDPHDCV